MKTRLPLILLAWLTAASAHADTLTVTNANDNVRGSLRSIVRSAAAGDVVVFEEALAGDTITLTHSEILITVPITVDASALSEKIILSGNEWSRIFNVETEEPCLFKGIHFTKGRTGAQSGGALFANASSFEDCEFTSNSTTSFGAGGGAVYGGTTFTNCIFTNNSTAGDYTDGGAVKGGTTFTNCTFISNSTAGSESEGGAVYGGTTFTSCTFTGNSTAGNESPGGAVYGGTTFTSCTFTGNSTAGSDSPGGAVTDGNAFTNCTFAGNSSGSEGGAVSGGDSFTNCTFTGNSTTSDYAYGGAVAGGDSFTNCTFTGNSTTRDYAHGGAVYDGKTFTHCTFTSNSAAGERAYGGAVYQGLTFTNCTFTNNSTTGEYGYGGALYNPRRVYNCTIRNNTTSGKGGGVRVAGTSVSFLNSIIANNTANDGGMDVAGNITSLGGNIIGVADGSIGWLATDSTGSIGLPLDPMLEAYTCGDLEVFRPMAGSPALGIGRDTSLAYLCLDICGERRFASCIDAGAVQVSACGGELAGRGSNADCAPTSVPPARKTAAVSFTAYPSPTTGRVQLRGELPAGGSVYLTVVDAAGRRVLESSHPASAGVWETTLDLSALPAGVYAIVLQTAAGLQSVRVARQ